MSYPRGGPPVHPSGRPYHPAGSGGPLPGAGAPPEPQLAPRGTPPTVVLIAAAAIVGGTVALLAAGWMVLASVGGPAYTDAINVPAVVRDRLAGAGAAVGVGLAVGGLFAIWVGRQLQRRRRWAWTALVTAGVVDLGATLYAAFTGSGTANAFVGVVVPVLLLIGLNTAGVRAWFRGGG